MLFATYIAFFALLNRLRGWGPTDGMTYPPRWRRWLAVISSKYACAVYAGGFVYSLTGDPILGGIMALGFAFWAVWGWGDYWDFSDRPNDEVGLIDWIVQQFLPAGEKADFLAMSLRGLFILPLFTMLAIYTGSLVAFFLGFAGLLQGPVYWIHWRWMLKKYGHPNKGKGLAELAFGAVMGAAIGMIFGGIGA